MTIHTTITPLHWQGDALRLLDQRALPVQEIYLLCASVADVVQAIRTLAVRGAPLIGIAAAYGMVIAAQTATSPEELLAGSDLWRARGRLR